MSVLIVSGSPRKKSQSVKVAGQFKKILSQRFDVYENINILDLSVNRLPMWPLEDVSKEEFARLNDQVESLTTQLKKADALVIISPEFHGMASPALKNFFMYCSGLDIAHKPALAVGVSSGRGGRYPITELRISSFKNNHLLYIPENMVISNVAEEFEKESYCVWKDLSVTEQRASACLNMLLIYAEALKGVRNKLINLQQDYLYGM